MTPTEQKLREALEEILRTARPSFLKTPYRRALDNAKKLLDETR